MIEADVFRIAGRTGKINSIRFFLTDRTFRPIVTYRIAQSVRKSQLSFILYPLTAIIHRILCQLAGMDFPLRASIGRGLALVHGWGLVVSSGAKIGRNVTLFHGVTIGQGDRISDDGQRVTGYPVLEDDVWVGPNATIVGGVRVGAGSRILANSVVTSDIPARSLVSGIPASVIRADCPPDVLNRWM